MNHNPSSLTFTNTFLANPLWKTAKWSGSTFCWHPTEEQPPVMGMLFDEPPAAQELFIQWIS